MISPLVPLPFCLPTAPTEATSSEPRIQVVSVAGLIAEAIRRTHNEESISSLFA